jgi:hypothetical protein
VATSDFDLSLIKTFSRAGLNLAAAGTAFPGAGGVGNGLRIKNNGNRVVRIRNASGAAVTITTKIAKVVDGQAVASRTQAVPLTTGDYAFGPWPVSYNDSDGMVTIEASAVATVTYDVLEMPSV